MDSDSGADVDFDESASSDGDEGEAAALPNQQGPGKHASANKSSGKLWCAAQFPEGTSGSANYDLANLMAAQEWSCPCPDRKSCIGPERLSVLELYEHRKDFQTTARTHGGCRDATRKALEQRLDAKSQVLMRAFKVGPLVDCCAASAGLASGVSFATWANARADMKKKRPWRNGRRRQLSKVESYERAQLNAYIRDLRSGMEGPKGGSDPTDKWRTDKMPVSKRWERYKEFRLKRALPVIGALCTYKWFLVLACRTSCPWGPAAHTKTRRLSSLACLCRK